MNLLKHYLVACAVSGHLLVLVMLATQILGGVK